MEAPGPPDAEALLQRAGDGDDEAFSQLYDCFAPVVYGLVVRIVHDPGAAEKVTCTIFIRAWRQAREYDPGICSAQSWLLDLAHRQAVDAARSSSESDFTQAREPAAIDCVELRRLLDDLPAEDRLPVTHAYFDALTYREVASVCHLSADAVKLRLHDGMTRLRERTDTNA